MNYKNHLSVFLCTFFIFSISCARYMIIKDPINIESKEKIGKEICYELIGWDGQDDQEKTTLLLRRLHESKEFTRVIVHVKCDIPLRLQIILSASPKFQTFLGEHPEPVSWMVERKPLELSLFMVNRILAARTLFLFPVFRRNDDTVIFRIWEKENMIQEQSYRLETVDVFGWVALGLAWSDDHKKIDKMYGEVVLRYLADIKDKL